MYTPLTARVLGALMLTSLVLAGRPAGGQPPPPPRERVNFAPGAASATIKGQLKGDATIDYVVRAAAGQTLAVTLVAGNRSTYFNVLSPGSHDVAMYAPQTGDPYTGLLPADGDYTVRVYLVRAAARRKEASTYTLTIGVTGKALAPLPGARDAKISGTPFHATAQVQCVPNPYVEQTLKPCDAGVIRRGTGGTATVEISLGTAGTRRILFVQGKPVASDAAGPITATRQSDTTIVSFDSGERHEIPDALVAGG